MEFLIKAGQLILSLSILVTLHELGHFVPARLFGTRVERFFLFFDWRFALWKRKIGDTVFGIGWIPLGGYVKISGMIDESMDRDQMAQPPQPWEFRSKPAWQRLIIMVGGVTVNLLLGMLIYIAVLFTWGRDYLPLENATYGLHPSNVLKEQGLADGDRIVAVEGHAVRSIEELGKAILIEGARHLTIDRQGRTMDVTLGDDVADRILERNEKTLFTPCVPFYVDTLLPEGTAMASGLRKGDRLIAVNGQPTPWFAQFREAVGALQGRQVTLGVLRGTDTLQLPVQVNDQGLIGVGNRGPEAYFTFAKERYDLLSSIPAGIAYGMETLGGYVASLKLLFSASGVKQMGGFGSIGSLFSPSWDWQVFWNMTAFLSIVLAFMNILPIPALDGGHVVFLLYEMVFRRAPDQRVLEVAQTVGMVLLLGLILFANGNDVVKWVTGHL
ncbi:MAG: RIP metalloprotease RseP [Flavobacteriales bacterium]|nr:putative zinc metalloprotease [Flavobacteriales bacterium]MCC6576172.1 RIP metalloprotease RseP [Flavobacteriales bacterium]NUQ13997.1 RIP metalloprotease RseP [Flavobacteriales bacterium]